MGTQGAKVTKISGLEGLSRLKVGVGAPVPARGHPRRLTRRPPPVQVLVLRSNLITKMEGLGHLDQLEELELYDNQIKEIADVASLVRLRSLDLSFNKFKEVRELDGMQLLQELFLASNRLQSTRGLGVLTSLRKLDLGSNRIRVRPPPGSMPPPRRRVCDSHVQAIEGLEPLEQLEELWLGKNKISRIEVSLAASASPPPNALPSLLAAAARCRCGRASARCGASSAWTCRAIE